MNYAALYNINIIDITAGTAEWSKYSNSIFL